MVGIQCNNRDAAIEWTPSGDNRAPILTYTIQFNTSFTPDSWEVSFENVPATETRFKVEMSPWSNYTFRVIARNKIGPSLPSDHSSMCTTPPDVPNKNPDNVEGRGTSPTNLVVTWNPMPEIEHNGRNFHYRVYWRRDIPGEDWNIEMISDWRQSSILIPNQPTFKRYRIKGDIVDFELSQNSLLILNFALPPIVVLFSGGFQSDRRGQCGRPRGHRLFWRRRAS